MPFYYYLSLLTILVAVSTGICFFSKLRSGLLYLFIFTCLALLSEFSIIVLYLFGSKNNFVLSHIYFPIELLFLSLLYFKEFAGSVKRKWIIPVVVIFMLYSVVNPIFFQGINEYSHFRSFSSIVLVMFSIAYFYQVMMEAKIKNLSREPMIWINTAVLFYFSASLFYNVQFTLILDSSKEFALLATHIFGISSIIFYVLITIGFWKAARPKVNNENRFIVD